MTSMAVHPHSRKARKLKATQRRNQAKIQHRRRNMAAGKPKVLKMRWFQSQVQQNPSKLSWSYNEITALAFMYMRRFDGEYEAVRELNDATRNKPKANREEALRRMIAEEDRMIANEGYVVPDLRAKRVVYRLRAWDGQSPSMKGIPTTRIKWSGGVPRSARAIDRFILRKCGGVRLEDGSVVMSHEVDKDDATSEPVNVDDASSEDGMVDA